MPLVRSLPYGRAAALAGCLTLASLYACSDRQPTSTAPDAGTEARASGVWASTVWSIGPSGLTYSGGVTGRAWPTDGGKRLTLAREGVRALSPSAADLEARRTALQRTLLRVPRLPKAAPAGARRPILRMAFRGARTFTTRTADGKELQTQLIGGSRGGSPTAGVLVSVDGRPHELIEYGYAHDGGQRRLLSMRSTLFGADGRPEKVIATDFRGVADATAPQVSALDRVLHGAGSLAGGLASLVGPTPLCAQAGCVEEQLAWGQAHDALWYAEQALQQAYAACEATASEVPRPYPDPCGDPVYNAQVAYNQASWNLFAAQVNLDQCYATPPPPPGGGGGGGGGGGQNCYWVDWYVSFDDGASWQWFESDYYCQNQT